MCKNQPPTNFPQYSLDKGNITIDQLDGKRGWGSVGNGKMGVKVMGARSIV